FYLMPHPSNSLIEIFDRSSSQIENLFLSAQNFSSASQASAYVGRSIALLFFEPSTRTKLSFQIAAGRLGLQSLLIDGSEGTSLVKGESIEDTVLNVAAMLPELIVIRCGQDFDLTQLKSKLNLPLINAGWGASGHPTQALLDVLTLKANGRSISQEKILIVGDVKHSRVAHSHFQLAKVLGYELAICGPASFAPSEFSGRSFDNLADGMKWASTVMALRVQRERHSVVHSLESYQRDFGINRKKLQGWREDGLLLHPGPVNYGVELDLDVQRDPRCKILDQVRWGTFLRQALLAEIMTERKIS
ncbi:MAG: aspartate carbamoyltransferase catalytic subunit, partial [Proteobacteria bacterium]